MGAELKHHIKGYEVRERIGAGGFGAVYRAVQTTVGREVAIKVILPGLANQPDFIRRFDAEAQIIARLEHPHITPLHDYWRDADGAYLVMRWFRGGSLRDALENRPFELRTASLLLDQIAGALSLAHRSGVIHRDIKPANILLDEDGNAYLTDFGIAKDLNLSGSHTAEDAITGSLDYISPEQARSERVTPRTDIYSLGVTMFEVIAGHHPFENVSAVERLYKHINDPLPQITSLEPQVCDQINYVIQKATAKNPEHRYPDALSFAAEFREAVGMSRTPTNVVEVLTKREQEILQLITEGLSNKEIAHKLTVTQGTVKWYVTQIYSKLGVRSRVQAIVRARELQLIVKSGEVAQPVRIPTGDFSPENPYKGLHAFQAADYQDFFGREKVTAKLLKRMGESGDYCRFLAVVGPSGSGKSSLVKAGLIPALWRGDIPGSEKWFVVEMLPGSQPLDELEVALTRIAVHQTANLNEHLRRDARGLVRTAGLILPDDGSELVLVIDQFEEVFTLVQDESLRAHFLLLLYTAVTEARSRIRVIVTLRADFYDRPLHYPQFGELVRSRLETIMPLSAEELERAISQPAERVGLTFEPGLVASIIADVNYQPGALPLLQYALTELFEKRQGRMLNREAYSAIGGTVGALAKRADEIYKGLDSAGQEAMRQMFLRLITLGEGTEDTRRRTGRLELQAVATDSDVIDDIIDTLVSYRLLSLDTDPTTRTPTVELAHEAIIREWERLREWLNDTRDDIRTQRQLSAMAAEWRDAKRDVSFLARGARLDQFEKWVANTGLALTPLERDYLEASFNERHREVMALKAQKEREARLERRSRRFLRGLIVVFALAAVVAGGLSAFAFGERNRAETALSASQQSAAEFRSIALTFGAQDALTNRQPHVALALASEAVNMEFPPLQAVNTFKSIGSAAWMKQRLQVSTTARVFDTVYHPDGQRIVATSWDGTVSVWNIKSGEMLQSIRFDEARGLSKIVIHPDGQRIFIGSRERLIRLWNIETNEVTELVHGEGAHLPLAITRDGSRLVSANLGTILIWDVETLSIVLTIDGHNDFTPSGQFGQDETLLITSSHDGFARIWDIKTGELVQELNHNQGREPGTFSWVWYAKLLNNDRWALSGYDLKITLWDVATGAILWTVDSPRLVQDIDVTSDEEWFVAGLESAPSAQLYHTATGRLIRTYVGHNQRVQMLDISPDDQTFITGSIDFTVGEWQMWWEGAESVVYVPLGEVLQMAQHPTEPFIVLGLILTQESLTTGNYDTDIYVINTETGAIARRLAGSPDFVHGLAFSPDGRYMLSGSSRLDADQPPVLVWDWETGEIIGEFPHHNGHVTTVAVSPDGRTAASGDALGSQVYIWDLLTGEVIHHLTGHNDWVQNVIFSPDGKWLYSTGNDLKLYQWDVTTGELVKDYGEGSGGRQLRLTADGSKLVVGSRSKTVVLDTATGAVLYTLGGSENMDLNAAETLLLLYSSDEGVVTLWDMQTGQEYHRFTAYPPMTAAAILFDKNTNQIITVNESQFIRWNIPDQPTDLAAWLKENRHAADFTCEQRDLYFIEPLCMPV